VLRKWVVRRRVPVAAATSLVALLTAIAVVGYHLNRGMALQRLQGIDEGNSATQATREAEHGKYQSAVRYDDQAIALGRKSVDAWARSAYLHLLLGHREEYRRRCREILGRFGDTDLERDGEYAAEVCLASPEALDDWTPVVRLTGRLYSDPDVDPGGATWVYIVKGMADYRVGRPREALAWLNKAEPLARRPREAAIVRYLQAMARYRLGETAAARERFLKACEWYAADPTINSDYTNLFLMYFARTEAEKLMGADAPDPGWWKYRPPPTPPTLPCLIQAEDFDEGGEGVGYHDYDGPNFFLGWNYRPATADTEPCADEGGGWNVGGIREGEWLAYTVDVPETGKYDLDVRVSSLSATGQFRVELDGRDVTGKITVPQTYDWQIYRTVTRPALALPAGRHTLRLVFSLTGNDDCACNFNWLQLRRS
jgi:hypothetical protein